MNCDGINSFNYNQAAKYIGISVGMLKEFKRKKLILFSRYGRRVVFYKHDLDSFIEIRRVDL